MAQTIEILPGAKKIYKKFLQNKFFDKLTHGLLNLFVNTWSNLKGFYFPEKFSWDWKLEMLSQKYEEDTTNLFKKIIQPNMTVIDIGGHIGYYTTLFAKIVGNNGKVYAFEADNDNFKLLEKNTGKYKNVILTNKAISDKTGEISFFKINNSTGCHSIIKSENSQIITVPATTLDEFAKQNNIEKIDVIKIDIEGGEPFAFKGMKELFSKSKSLTVVMEFSPEALKKADVNPLEFLQEIKDYGFAILQIFPDAQTKFLELNNIENLEWYRTGYANLLLKK